MKKVALVFVLAVIVPSLVLAWLAVRSLRDQQYLLEHQQSLLYQAVADGVTRQVQDVLATCEQDFVAKVNELLSKVDPIQAAKSFDEDLCRVWPLAQVGFVVSLQGDVLSPSLSRPEARLFMEGNRRFLASREAVEVYLDPKQAYNNSLLNKSAPLQVAEQGQSASNVDLAKRLSAKFQQRSVIPQQQVQSAARTGPEETQQLSKLASAEAEFSQLVGQQFEGALA